MKIYLVGGAVRDILLGLTPKDKDYVVVGATEQQMLALGYTKVGADFPVFLHPQTGEEYALARKERKVAAGYNGFAVDFDPSVTLAEDLIRRDLTINSMAMDEDGNIIDPHGGQEDLQQGILRHTSDAFAEDPVRILRTARFAARYNFTVAPETIELMVGVAPELNVVPQERIWAEFEKGLMEKYPANMMDILYRSTALETTALRPYVGFHPGVLNKFEIDTPLESRFCFISYNFNDSDYVTCKIPTAVAKISKLYHTEDRNIVGYSFNKTWYPEQCIQLFERFRAFSDTGTLMTVVDTLQLFSRCMSGDFDFKTPLLNDLNRINLMVDSAAIAATCNGDGKQIKQALFEARLEIIKSEL